MREQVGRNQVLAAPPTVSAPVPYATLDGLFQRRAASVPGAIAVVDGTERLSYRELDRRAGELALALAGRGVGPGAVVALLLPRSADLVVAILAVLRAGAVYQPIDPWCPGERIEFMLDSTQPTLAVTDLAGFHAAPLSGRSRRLVLGADSVVPAGSRSSGGSPDQLAYITYTSGWSGVPRGVAVTHRNVAALALDRCWRGGTHDRVLLHSPYTVDAFTYELWVPLLNGGRVVVAPDRQLEPDRIRDLVSRHGLTALWLTANVFAVVADEQPACLAGLREVWIGGDDVPAATVDKVRRVCRDLSVVNGYGPTETTAFATYHRIPPGNRLGTTVPIGRPPERMRSHVLGPELVPVSVGAAGELYIGGEGLARGYLSASGMTAERFVACPFAGPGERMYRTGDLARWNTDGDLEYLGRVDSQVTVRGHLAGRPPERIVSTVVTVLAAAFADVLGLDQVGMDDDFVTAGGDSIRAIQVVAHARIRGVRISAREIFQHRTVAGLAAVVGTAVGRPATVAELAGGGVGSMPLLPAGRWLLASGGPIGRFAMSMVLRIPDGLTEAGLEEAVAAVLDRHDLLRARLLAGEEALEALPVGAVSAASLVRRVSGAGEEVLAAEVDAAGGRLDPVAGVMAQFVWFVDTRCLAVVVHHLAVDGVSWRVLVPDLASAWEQVSQGRPVVLPAVGTSVRRWAVGLLMEAVSPARVAEFGFWRGLLSGDDPLLGSRRLHPAVDTMATVESLRVSLPAGVLTDVVKRLGCAVDEVLLAGLVLALTRWRGERAPRLVRLAGHGRQDGVAAGTDLSRTVGWFTSLFPVRLDSSGVDVAEAFAGGPAAGQAVNLVREQLRGVPGEGFGYGLLRYLNERTSVELAGLAQPQIGFTYLGRLSRSDLGGWTPLRVLNDVLVAPDSRMPATSPLELTVMVTDTGTGPEVTALVSFASRLLPRVEVEECVDLWRQALVGLVRHAVAGHGRVEATRRADNRGVAGGPPQRTLIRSGGPFADKPRAGQVVAAARGEFGLPGHPIDDVQGWSGIGHDAADA